MLHVTRDVLSTPGILELVTTYAKAAATFLRDVEASHKLTNGLIIVSK